MSYSVDMESRKAALDRLKFSRRRQNGQSPYDSSSSSSSPYVGHQAPSVAPPAQSRDATTRSRFFTTQPSNGTVIVPDSSPLRQDFDRPYQHHQMASEAPPIPGLLHRNSWGQTGWNKGVDPISGPSGFITSYDGSHANFSRPQVPFNRQMVGNDVAVEMGSPLKRVNHGQPGFSDPLDLLENPASPEIQRPGAKRRKFQHNGGTIGSPHSPDGSLPDVHGIIAGPSKPRIIRGQRPEADENAETEKLNRFIMIHPGDSRERIIAAYKQCNGDVPKATNLLLDAGFKGPPTPVPSPSVPDSRGRVLHVDKERQAARVATKEKGKNSHIYKKRQDLDTAVTSTPTPPPSSVPSIVQTSPTSPVVGPRPPRRQVRKQVIDSGSEAEPELVQDDSDAELVSGSKWSRFREEAYFEQKALESFNTHASDALRELTGCSTEQANKIISLRPFSNVQDLEQKLGQGRKKVGPAGISPRIFQEVVDIYQGYGSVDDILEDCERIGALLRAAIASWSSSVKGKGKEGSSSEALLDDDMSEDGALNLQSLDVSATSGDFLAKAPSLLASTVQLKDYQLLGVNWLNLLYSKNLSCILADEMGLGKTVQVISFFAHLKGTGCKGPHLIVVPSSTLENWCREFERFAPSISVQTYYAGKEERPQLRQDLLDTRKSKSKTGAGWEVLITTYNLANGDERDRKFFRRMDWNTCIFDEGHVLKNFQSQRYQALMRISAKWKLLLTGTPLQNNLQELVSLMNFILPNRFEDTMESLRAIFKVKGDSGVSLLAEARVSRAKKMMTPFVLRRRKDQVLKDLPKKTERIEWCEMSARQKRIYRDALQRSRKTIFDLEHDEAVAPSATVSKGKDEAPPKKGRANTRTKEKMYLENSSNVLMDLRKAASHPMLFRTLFTDEMLTSITRLLLKEADFKKRGAMFQYVKEDMEVMTDAELQNFCATYKSTRKFLREDECYLEAGKIQAMLRLLDMYQAEGRRCLIFSQFTQILDILKVVLKHKSMKYLILTGSTAVDVRQALVDEFTEDESILVFLLSTKAGGMGINLTAASVVIMFDQDFNPHNDRQAADRAYRIGQKRDVEIVKLITRGTIEEDMLRLGQTKLALDEAVAGDADDGEGKGESAPEKIMKTSLMESLRKQLDSEDQGVAPELNGVEESHIDVDSDLTDLDA